MLLSDCDFTEKQRDQILEHIKRTTTLSFDDILRKK
jgi:hypothetical protein